MQTSSRPLSTAENKRIKEQLYTLLADLRHPQDVATFLQDFLSETEQQVLAKRLAILHQLHQGKSYEKIKKALQVSSATISSVAEMKGKPGFKLALEKIKLDQWAENVLGNLKQKLPFGKKSL